MDNIQLFSILGSLILISAIILLVRQRKLKEEYSLLWLFFSGIFLFLSVWREALDWFALKVGISYAPAALFLILIMSIFIIMIEFSIIISRQSEWIKQSAQYIGLMKLELNTLEKKNEEIIKAITKLYEIENSYDNTGKSNSEIKRKTKRDKANGNAKWKLKQNMEKISEYLD